MTVLDSTLDKMVPAELEDFVRNVEEIPTIPESLIQIMRVLDDQNSGSADLAEVVRLDTPLMSKILRLANSPYYSHQGSMSDINRCVAVLGYRTVRQMALNVSVVTSLVSAVARTDGQLDYRELWKHSVVVGSMAKELAVITGYFDPEEVFTAGLLHDIGKFIMEIQDSEKYDRLIEARAETGRSLVEMEIEEFGFDHAALGGTFGKIWSLPEFMTNTLANHHNSLAGELTSGTANQSLALVKLADYLANTMVPPRSDLGFDPRHVEPPALNRAAGISLHDLGECLGRLRRAVDMASEYMHLH